MDKQTKTLQEIADEAKNAARAARLEFDKFRDKKTAEIQAEYNKLQEIEAAERKAVIDARNASVKG